MRQPGFAALALGIATAAVVSAQQRRDAPAPPVGTAAIAGSVVTLEGAPVRGARVALVGNDVPTAIVTTGDDGAFKFDRLPSGGYRLWAARPGFVAASYGEKRPGFGLPGAWILLDAGQRREQLRLQLPRGAAITGTVLDAAGDPAVGAIVLALQIVMRRGRATFQPAGIHDVNDRGMYRIHGLPPGEYLVAAVAGRDFTPPIAAVYGGPGFSHVPVELIRPEDTGPLFQPAVDPSATFHPRATRLADAARLNLAAGEDRSGVDVRIIAPSGVRVTGTVRGPDRGLPPGDMPRVTLVSKDEPETWSIPGVGARSARVEKGVFAFSNVPPGRYELRGRFFGGEKELWASQELSVGVADVEGLSLILAPTISVSGSVELDLPGPLPEIEYIYFIDPAASDNDPHNGRGRIFADGTFIAELLPGHYRVRLPGYGEGYVPEVMRNLMPELASKADARIVSAMFGTVDALDFPIEVGSGDIPPARITGTRRPAASISGAIIGTRDPATNYHVIAFASDARYWTAGSRRNVSAEADARGGFTIKHLPAGHYRLAIVEDFDSLTGVHPAFIRQVAPRATAEVVLKDGESITQDVRVR